jgi:hypothetical protein
VQGAALAKLRIEEREGAVFWLPEPHFSRSTPSKAERDVI